jgi:hypothetical protein
METAFKKQIDWEIKCEPVLIGHQKQSNKKAIFRNDNGKLLGFVGKGYSPIHNQTLTEIALAIEASGQFELDGFIEHKEGRMIYCFLSNKNIYLNVNGHKVFEQMILSNSHDGTRRFTISSQTAMERCGNKYAQPLEVFSKKHTQPIDSSKINIEQMIKMYQDKKDKMYAALDGMDSIPVSDSLVEKLIKEIHSMLSVDSSVLKENNWIKKPSMQNLKESIKKEMNALGNNLFGLFNGVTWYTSHEMRNCESEHSRLNGKAADINQKAFRFCNNLKNHYNKQQL